MYSISKFGAEHLVSIDNGVIVCQDRVIDASDSKREMG